MGRSAFRHISGWAVFDYYSAWAKLFVCFKYQRWPWNCGGLSGCLWCVSRRCYFNFIDRSRGQHLIKAVPSVIFCTQGCRGCLPILRGCPNPVCFVSTPRSEEHTSELQSRFDLVCRLLLEKKKQAN